MLVSQIPRSLPVIAVVLLLVGSPLGGVREARAHGDDHVLIEALTDQLANAPAADLYIRRGELFRHHEEWEKAEADYAAAAQLAPGLASIDYFRARSFLEAGAPEKARPFIDRYISRVPDEPEGWFLRGDVLAVSGRHEAGAAEYAEGLRRTSSPRPEHFLRRARFLAVAPDADPGRVIAALDEGIAHLGPVISLVEFALALELEQQNHAAALLRLRGVIERAPRPETWLVREADLLVKCGRGSEAIASYRAALTAIDDLPARYRETLPIEKLAQHARAALSQLTTSTTNK